MRSSASRATSSSTAPGSTTSFMAGRPSQDRKLHFNQNLALRGGWRVGASVLFETLRLRREPVSRLRRSARPTPDGGTAYRSLRRHAAAAEPRLRAVVHRADAQGRSTADGLILWGKDENFYEWSSADIVVRQRRRDLAADRPAPRRGPLPAAVVPAAHRRQLRRHPPHPARQGRVPGDAADLRAGRRRAERRLRRTRCATTRAPSLPIYIRDDDGRYEPAPRRSTKRLRLDWLFSYQPTPGTVVFAGYGSSLEEAETVRGRLPYRRLSDGFFAKVSYLFRL